MRKVNFTQNEYYHIYNRGTDKRVIFYKEKDYLRFVYSIYKSNSVKSIFNLDKLIRRHAVQGLALNRLDEIGDRWVNICYACLIPNHFHLVVQQEKDKGVEKFMQKLGTSYTMYFNKRYDRDGVLFQGPFQAIAIEDDSYLMQISQYIHLNPLKLIEPEFREKGIRDFERAKRFLRAYKWSTYLDYIGIRNLSFLVNNSLHIGYFRSPGEYEKFVLSGIKKFKA